MSKAAEAVSPGQSRIGAQPTIGGSIYVKPQDMDWAPTQFAGVSIKVLYEDKEKGEMTCLLKWEPGTSLPGVHSRLVWHDTTDSMSIAASMTA